MYTLIIFDCDGVLVDSEQLSAQVFSDVLRLNHIQMTADECFRQFKGLTLRDCYSLIEKKCAVALPSDFDTQLTSATRQAFESSLRAIDGVKPLLEQLKKTGIRYCVASNGGHAKIRHALSLTGLIDDFEDKIFSAQDVEAGKPMPDLFLYTASEMGANVKECCVIEDSLTGLMAANAAAMDVVYFNTHEKAFDNTQPLVQAPSATYNVQSMNQLQSLLAYMAANSR